MKVISPLQLTSGMITTSAVEVHPTWSSATTYALGARVVYGNFIYESLQASNTNRQPDINPTWWLEVSPSNLWAAFDNSTSTKTTGTSPLTFVITTGNSFNSLALLGLTGNEVQITFRDSPGGTIVYSQTINLNDPLFNDWYGYFFDPFDFREDVVLFGIPPYASGQLTISILAGSGSASVSTILLGSEIALGTTQYGLSVGIRDFSIKETDEFGNTKFIQRAFSKRMEGQVFVDNANFRFVTRVLTNLRAVPAVWIGSEDERFEPTIVYGFFRDYTKVIDYPTASLLSVQIEGLS